ncbi:MAK10-like protein [Tanacetum coccineum]|uniref:MAK10-like protein n=1 Tax=Tanacetum coccineum TaxID=301880 RepID=A0ABQ5BVC7_9ASTR
MLMAASTDIRLDWLQMVVVSSSVLIVMRPLALLLNQPLFILCLALRCLVTGLFISLMLRMLFLTDHLSKTVYMHQPPDFVNPRCPNYVCLLQRSLYGLKQASCAWFQRFAGYVIRVGFSHSRCDSMVIYLQTWCLVAYLLIYVDDIVLTASSTTLLQRIISSLHREFEMTDLGALNYFLGIFVSRNNTGISTSLFVYALPQDVPSTSDSHLIELENKFQCLMEAHLALTQPTQVNKITTSCEICSGPHYTQYCMKDPEQAFVEYASSRTDESGTLTINQTLKDWYLISWHLKDAYTVQVEADFKQQQSEMTNKIDTVLKAITDRIAGTLPSDMVKNPKLSTYPVLSARSYPTEDPQCSTQTHGSINAITIHTEQQSASYNNGEKENKKEEDNLKNIHFDPPTPPDLSVTIKGMHVFVGNFTYIVDFMIIEEISSIIDPRLSQVVLGKPFEEMSNMTHDPPEGVVRRDTYHEWMAKEKSAV